MCLNLKSKIFNLDIFSLFSSFRLIIKKQKQKQKTKTKSKTKQNKQTNKQTKNNTKQKTKQTNKQTNKNKTKKNGFILWSTLHTSHPISINHTLHMPILYNKRDLYFEKHFTKYLNTLSCESYIRLPTLVF